MPLSQPRALSSVHSTETVKRVLPWLVAVAFFMEALDTTILNTAVPTMAHALSVSPLSMKAVLASYTLSLAAFIPISGWMADRLGTRLVFACATALFTIGSLFCGLCHTIESLVACRVLQGCGGAMMVPVGRLALVRTFAKSELLHAMSLTAMPGLVGPMLGPVVGGFIVAYFHWRIIFFINLPIGILGLYFGQRYMPDYREQEKKPLDWPGLILFGVGISLMSYVLEVFGEHTLNGPSVLALFLVSCTLLAAYGWRAARIPFPLLELTLFRVRTYGLSVGNGFLTRLGMGGSPFLLPLLYQAGLGYTPVQSGLMLLPQAFAAMSLKITMPWVIHRLGYRRVLIGNTLLLALLIFSFSCIQATTPVTVIAVLAFAYGFVTSLQYTSMNSLAYADVAERYASQANTLLSAVQQLSFSFAVALASLITGFFIPDRLHVSAGDMIHGIHSSFVVLSVWTALTALGFLGLKPQDGR